MRTNPRLLIIVVVLSLVSVLYARSSDNLSFVKDVPEGSTIEFRVRGALVQSAPLTPGRYRVAIERIKQ